MQNKIIILNKMYSGTYLKDGNLGHEVINLYKSDNGSSYIYLLSSGKIDKQYSGRIFCVLLVRQHENNLLEILGKAIGLEEVYCERREIKDKYYQKKYIEENDIKYGGVLLNEIFQGDDYQDTCITYKAEKVISPKEPIYIQFAKGKNNDLPILIDINRGQSSHQYVYEKNVDAYATLSDIIDNNDLWGDEVKTVAEAQKEIGEIPPHSIFDICRTSYSELAHSSALGYYLRKDKEFADRFLDEVLGIKSKLSDDYKVYLETVHRIDIFIADKDKAIIIENKIKSGINGVYIDEQKTVMDDQLQRYYEAVETDLNNAELVAKKKSKVFQRKNIHPFILVPNYSKIEDYYSKYEKIEYSQLYDLMRNYSAYETDSNFKIFTDTIKRHTTECDNGVRDEMFRLFAERLNTTK